MSQCKSCKAEVLWAVTKAGRAIPIDRVPVAHGNIVLQYPKLPRDFQAQ